MTDPRQDRGETEGSEMTTKQRILELAREICAKRYEGASFSSWVERYRTGKADSDNELLETIETLNQGVALGLEMAGEWQPIEIAPRDYKVLVYNQATGPYFSRAEGNEWPMHSWDDQNGVWYPQPTHWQPLPAPPARTSLAKPDAAS